MDKKIILNKYRYIDAENKNISTRLDLHNDKKCISEDHFGEVINEYNVYLDEREACNVIRLSAQVNLMASNSVFNSVTEIVKDEDSDDCVCLNFSSGVTISSAYGKPSLDWGSNIDDCIQDTQITYEGDDDKNYVYHCGIDIFDNHVLRSKVSTPNYYLDGVSNATFNTISDYLVDENGTEWISSAYNIVVKDGYICGNRHEENGYMHLYNKDNIMSFVDCLGSKLVDKNGWLGFLNKSKMDSYDSNGNNFGISRVINNMPVNSFIEMYPGKSHYSLMPYYNKKRHRQEKNWEYCLTYPSDSTVSGIPFINEKLNTLKIAFIDESELDDDDLQKTVIYSESKHGLQADDIVNIYKSTYDNSKSELVEENVIVDAVIDDYTFTVYLSDYLCKNWVSVFDKEQISTIFAKSEGSYKYYPKSAVGPEYVTSFNNYINADFDNGDEIGCQNLSFAKVIDTKQVEYYVRIFSRFPNFDFMDLEPTEENIYGRFNGNKRNIDEYSRLEYEKQSTLSRLAFAKNAYGDDMVQIVYNDDIDISNIKDNLGRPLTSLYLSFFKTNYGRKEWYNGDVKNKNVEHSHCFGKLNCGFELSPHLSDEKFYHGNTRLMNNIDTILGIDSNGLSQLNLRQHLDWVEDDEIEYRSQDRFYGDLCEYSASNCIERVIQPIVHRFNTQQRELSGTSFKTKASFSSVKYHNILRDDTTPNYNFTVTEGVFDNNVTGKKDGCTYISSYEIPIRTFSDELSKFSPESYLIDSLTVDKDRTYTATTNASNYLNCDTQLNFYEKASGATYRCDIVNILAPNVLSFNLYDENGKLVLVDIEDTANYILYRRPVGIPTYAKMIGNGIGEYRWRNVVQNGFENVEGIIEEYPFTNNCLYVNKLINIFVRRQDPFGEFGITKLTGFQTIDGKQSPIEADSDDSNSDDSINEKNSIC